MSRHFVKLNHLHPKYVSTRFLFPPPEIPEFHSMAQGEETVISLFAKLAGLKKVLILQ